MQPEKGKSSNSGGYVLDYKDGPGARDQPPNAPSPQDPAGKLGRAATPGLPARDEDDAVTAPTQPFNPAGGMYADRVCKKHEVERRDAVRQGPRILPHAACAGAFLAVGFHGRGAVRRARRMRPFRMSSRLPPHPAGAATSRIPALCDHAGMRVAHVNDIAYVGSTLVQALRSIGVEADLIEAPHPGAGWAYPWKVATLPFRLGGLLLSGVELRGGRYDLIHVHYARLGMLGPLSGRPYVIHCHGSDIRGVRPGSAWGHEMRPFLAGAAKVFFATPDLAPWVCAFRPDATFLPNPIVVSEEEAWTDHAGKRRDLLVGVRLDATKGVAKIEQVLRALIRRRPQTSTTIIAQGPGVSFIHAAAGRDAQVCDPVAHAAMPRLFAAHRVAIGQMRVGAIGNYELEALAANVPVAASFRFPDAYPTPPPVLDGNDSQAIAGAIADLLDDERAREARAESGRSWVRQYHCPSAIAARLAADYAALGRRP